MNKFPSELDYIPLEWYMIAFEKGMPEEKIHMIFRVFKDIMIVEKKESTDWYTEWCLWVLSRSL